jgi:hypothetical protein
MRILSPLLVSKPTAIALTTVAAIVVILFAANVTITTAQQQQQQQQQQELVNSTQPGVGAAQNATLFENKEDSFRVQVPEGWVIQDVNNTGSALAAEVTQGYGILAQLCPEEEEGQQQQEEEALNNVSSISRSCQQQAQQEEIIHIIRYPNMAARMPIAFGDINNTIPDFILQYEIQKLQEVGYRDINIINSTDTTINVHYINQTQAEELGGAPEATVPARLVEITYSTNSAPSEIRRGYFLLTATNATPPNPGTVTGYSIFYEGVRVAAAEEGTTTPSGSLAPPPAAVRQVFDSFELIPSGVVQVDILSNLLEQRFGNQTDDVAAEEEPEDVGDENGNGGAEDEDGGDENGNGGAEDEDGGDENGNGGAEDE